MLPVLRNVVLSPHGDGAYVHVKPDGISITNPKYGGTVTRATTAYQFSQATGLFTSVAAGVDRCQHDVYSAGRGVWVKNTRLAGEPQRTNSALGSNKFGDGTYWGISGAPTIAVSNSCISGQSAYMYSGSGALPVIIQTVGTFLNGRTDCLYAILESGTALESELRLYDSTAPGTVGGVKITWSTLAVTTTVAGITASGVNNLGTGPNGGKLVSLWFTFTGTAAGGGATGNTQRAYLYMIGTGGTTTSATIHHTQFETNALFPSTPIVTTSAAVTRNVEIVSVPLPAAAQGAQALTAYHRYVNTGASLFGAAGFTGWRVSSAAPYWKAVNGGAGATGQVRAQYNNGVDGIGTSTAPSPVSAWADLVESRNLLLGTGAIQTGVALNASTETLAAATGAPAHGLASAWGDPTLYLGADSAGAAVGGQALAEFILAPGAPSTTAFRSFT